MNANITPNSNYKPLIGKDILVCVGHFKVDECDAARLLDRMSIKHSALFDYWR